MMRSIFGPAALALTLAFTLPASSASKPHVVFLGKPQAVKILVGKDESQSVAISVRPLYVDSKLKDYTTGEPHDVTDRDFVVQRAFRINDALPGDSPKQSKWIWQRGDWVLVDRISGHVVQLKLPEFDAANSHVSWYRDYAAYCGSPDGQAHWDAVVAQVGLRKALFRKEMSTSRGETQTPSDDCTLAAKWERNEARVTFTPANAEPFTVTVVPHRAEALAGNSEPKP